MSMTIATGRTIVQSNLRSNGFDTSLYDSLTLDYAIAEAGEELVRECNLLRTLGTATLASGSTSIGTLPTGLRPDRLTKVFLSGSNVQVTLGAGVVPPYFSIGAPVAPLGSGNRAVLDLMPYTDLLELSYATRDNSGNSVSGQPQAFAFAGLDGTHMFFPKADDAYTVNFEWNKLFTNWTLGDSGTSSFLLPDDYMLMLLRYGAPAKLQFNEPGNAYAINAQQQWSLYIKKMASKGDLGEQVIQRQPANRADGYGFETWLGGGP